MFVHTTRYELVRPRDQGSTGTEFSGRVGSCRKTRGGVCSCLDPYWLGPDRGYAKDESGDVWTSKGGASEGT